MKTILFFFFFFYLIKFADNSYKMSCLNFSESKRFRMSSASVGITLSKHPLYLKVCGNVSWQLKGLRCKIFTFLNIYSYVINTRF